MRALIGAAVVLVVGAPNLDVVCRAQQAPGRQPPDAAAAPQIGRSTAE
jgi:hypothetical protein